MTDSISGGVVIHCFGFYYLLYFLPHFYWPVPFLGDLPTALFTNLFLHDSYLFCVSGILSVKIPMSSISSLNAIHSSIHITKNSERKNDHPLEDHLLFAIPGSCYAK